MNHEQLSQPMPTQVELTPALPLGTQSSAQQEHSGQITPQEFYRMISVPVTEANTLLPTPASTSRQPTHQQPTPLRKSRRIANAGGPCHSVQRAQTVLMKKLGILGEQQLLTEEAREAYANLFEHPLSPCHIAALAALFGWTPPAGEHPNAAGAGG